MENFLTDPTALIAAVGVLTASLLGVARIVHHVFNTGRAFKVQSLELLHKSMLDNTSLASRLITEQLFQNQFKVITNYEVIKILLAHPTPSKCIQLYKVAKRYLVVEADSLVFSEEYRSKKSRVKESITRPIKNFFLAVFFTTIGASTGVCVHTYFSINTLLDISFATYNLSWVILLLSISFSTLAIAFSFFINEESIGKAEELESLFHT